MTTLPRLMVIDGMNAFHRARSGFSLGDHPVTFNFFRNLRATINEFKPTRVYVVLDGHPKKRCELDPTYKANRRVDPRDEAKVKSLAEFFRQVNDCVKIMEHCVPVSVMRHPDHECDDIIYNLIKNATKAFEWIVVSNDSDFCQLFDEFENVRVYDPIRKGDLHKPVECNYVLWKALRGDGTDNVPKIVSDKVAERLASDAEKLRDFLVQDPERLVRFNTNHELVKFITLSSEELMGVTSSSPTEDWESLRAFFNERQFNSITKDGAWEKFIATFSPLFGDEQC